MNGLKEKYNLEVPSPCGINLLDRNACNDYIETQIEHLLRECCVDFVVQHEVSPGTIRLSSDVFTRYKYAYKKALDKSYIDDADVKLDGIQVDPSCKSIGQIAILEYWEDDPQ